MIGMRKAAILNRHARVANTFQTFAIIVKKDGIRGLWRGSVATFWRVLPGTGISSLPFLTLQASILG